MKSIAEELIDELSAGAAVPAGCRLNHARGIIVEGYFRATEEAAVLSKASLFNSQEKKLVARFSSSGADEHIAENNPEAEPRGLAVRIGDDDPATFIGHSVEGFPATCPHTFLAFLKALNRLDEAPDQLQTHLQGNSAAQRFAQMRQDAQSESFLTLHYHMLHPFRLTPSFGKESNGRLTIIPAHQKTRPKSYGDSFLSDGMRRELVVSPSVHKLLFTPIPQAVDAEDISMSWPNSEEAIVLGYLIFNRIAEVQDEQRSLFFDLSELPSGIEFSGDPMIEARLQAYRIAGEHRKQSR